MTISTNSGTVTVNKRTPYGKFLAGYTSTPAWDGQQTRDRAWAFAQRYKTPSISWHDLGVMVGNMFADRKVNV